MAQNVKTVAGIALASVKTVCGLAIASVQTIAGVDNTGGGGGPTLVASDNFDAYAGATDLGSEANWVATSGNIEVYKPAADSSLIPSSGGTIGIVYNIATFAADQRGEVTIDAAAGSQLFDWIGVSVRCQSGSASCYAVIMGATDLYLIKINGGTQATINSDLGMTLVAGNRIAIEASGTGAATRLKVQVDTGGGWVDKWTNQDPGGTYLDGGAVGVASWLLSGNTNRIDDWFGYDL